MTIRYHTSALQALNYKHECHSWRAQFETCCK